MGQATSAYTGAVGYSNLNMVGDALGPAVSRWFAYDAHGAAAGNGYAYCSTPENLICFVNP